MNTGKQVNVAIVYTKEAKESAEFLRDLIEIRDDTEDKIIGIKDGSVKAVTFEEKKFKEENNTSSQKVIYIGDCKMSQSTKAHARWKIDMFGLKCGWFGNKAILYIDKEMSKKSDYEGFAKYGETVAKRLQEEFEKIENTTGKKITTALSIVSIIAWIPVPFVGIPGVSNLTIQAIKRRKQIRRQQYDTMVRAFYLEYLNMFVEG